MPVKRVVVGHNKEGKSVLIEDGPAPAMRTNPMRPGHVSNDIWKTGPLRLSRSSVTSNSHDLGLLPRDAAAVVVGT